MEAEEKRAAADEEEEEGSEALKSSLDPHLLSALLLEAFPESAGEFASFEEHLILEAPEEFRSFPDAERPPPAEAERDQENVPEIADTDAAGAEEVDTADREKVAGEEKKGEEGGGCVDQYAGHEESRENEQTANTTTEGSEKKGEHVGFGTTPVRYNGDTSCTDGEEVVVKRTDPGGMRDAVEESDARRPSIRAAAVADCASAPSQGCSRVSDAPNCAAPREDTLQSRDTPDSALGDSESVGNSESATTPPILRVIGQLQLHAEHVPSDLSLEFAATQHDLSILRAETESLNCTIKTETESDLLSSKDINKRPVESRLKHLEEKLKRAGLTDEKCKVISSDSDSGFAKYNKFTEKKQVVDKFVDYCDANQNCIVKCEFDAANINKYAESGFGDGGYFLVYDELDEDCDCENAVDGLTETMRGEGAMGTDGERKQHNPDRDNLKSLLKKPNRAKPDKKNRVVFNENRNEFFDADYIILIREDCDYDEDDDDGVCTCNQHEMVRLTCCEPNCNCNVYDGYDQTPQSPKFAPPIEFVDAVTLSPPEGYKDMELGEQQLLALQQMAMRGQMAAVCRECSQTHDEEGEGSEEEEVASDQDAETEKTDQSQQTTPTTPPPTDSEDPSGQRGAPEPVVMATSIGGGGGGGGNSGDCDERRPAEERLDSPIPNLQPGGSPISGILKGGRLWKQQSVDIVPPKPEPQQVNGYNNNRAQNVCSLNVFQASEPVTSDDEGGSKRSVRFTESDSEKRESRDSCDGAPEKPHLEAPADDTKEVSPSPEPMEMMLTFKLGNHVMISNNSLKPNSAVRQLFPCTKPLAKPEDDSQQYLVTSESLRAFEEAKRSKLPQIIPGESDESIKRAIERNTLRRSLIRYEPRSKKAQQKTDNSLVERIKQLTCDVDEPVEEEQSRASPPGEEARNSPEVTAAKSFSPSSSSSSNSSVSSTYKKITDLFAKKDRPDIQVVEPVKTHAPDLGGPQEEAPVMQKVAPPAPNNEHRKQFLSTLAPLTACVSGTVHPEDYYYHTGTQAAGDRMSMASSVGTEYSLEDIEEGLRKDEEETKRIAPDVLAGTPSASESGDELAMFVQQDASRIERIKKKYQQDDEDDEHDDYGFNRRPSVRGIKPRFGSTTEILQQIQSQMQPPPNSTPPRTTAPPVAWPYYSETNLSGVGVDNKRNINQQPPNYQYAQQYRPTTLIDENVYQNCANQRCAQVTYRSNVNIYSSPVMRVGGGCTDYYQSLPRARNGRPQSPPPQEVSKGFHQTMMYIPYNHIEGYQPVPAQYYDPGYVRVTNQNQINKRYTDPAYQEYAQKPVRAPYHIGRSESPLPGHYSTARATQTSAPTLSTCTFYTRYRNPPTALIWSDAYGTKANRHSFPQPRYPNPDNISLTDSDSHSSGQLHNGYKDSMPNSPTKPRFIERGVPEGAASVSPQDCNTAQSASTMTSPTSPQNPQTNSKPLFYAMNV